MAGYAVPRQAGRLRHAERCVSAGDPALAFPSRGMFRGTAELNGQVLHGGTTTLLSGTTLIGSDGSFAPLVSNTENLTRVHAGLHRSGKSGFFAGAGLSWNFPSAGRIAAFTDEPDVTGDYVDFQFRVGYHPGVKVYVPPAPPPPPPPAPRSGAGSGAQPVGSSAACDPCTVNVGAEFDGDRDGAGLDQLLRDVSVGCA